MPKEDILAFSVTQETQTIKFIWLILPTIRQNGDIDIVLDTPEFCYFLCSSQGSVATLCRCGGKYDTSLVANLLVSPTVKTFRKLVNICQSYERISSGTYFMAHSVFYASVQHSVKEPISVISVAAI